MVAADSREARRSRTTPCLKGGFLSRDCCFSMPDAAALLTDMMTDVDFSPSQGQRTGLNNARPRLATAAPHGLRRPWPRQARLLGQEGRASS